MLDDRLVEAFISVAETGSFRKSAELLHISSSGLAKQISILEEKVQVPLFDRTGEGTLLTEAGISLYKDLPRIDRDLTAAIARARNTGAVQKKTLIRFGVNLFSSLGGVTRLLRSLPGVLARFEVQYCFVSGDKWMQRLDQDYDFLLRPQFALELPGLCFHPLLERFACLYVPADHQGGGASAADSVIYRGAVILTLREGICPILDQGALILKSHDPSLQFVRSHSVISLEMINAAVGRKAFLFLPDLGEDIHPDYFRIEMEYLPKIPYGLVSSDRPSGRKDAFLKEIDEGIRIVQNLSEGLRNDSDDEEVNHEG